MSAKFGDDPSILREKIGDDELDKQIFFHWLTFRPIGLKHAKKLFTSIEENQGQKQYAIISPQGFGRIRINKTLQLINTCKLEFFPTSNNPFLASRPVHSSLHKLSER